MNAFDIEQSKHMGGVRNETDLFSVGVDQSETSMVLTNVRFGSEADKATWESVDDEFP